jgi:hypothetical protein
MKGAISFKFVRVSLTLTVMKKKTRLLLWTIFCILGLIMNVIAFVDYMKKQSNFRIFMTALWIVIFAVAAYSTFIKYRKELNQDPGRIK